MRVDDGDVHGEGVLQMGENRDSALKVDGSGLWGNGIGGDLKRPRA